MRARAGAIGAALLVVIAACSSGGDEAPPAPATTARDGAPAAQRAPSPTTTAAPAPTTAAPTTSTAPPAGPTAAITIQNFAFSPPVLNVAAGTTVTTTNRDSAPHSWTADDGSWDSGTLGQNTSYSYRFGRSGTFSYYCAIHPSMKGTVNVA